MNRQILKIIPFCAAFVLPLNKESGWSELKFNKIPANQVEFSGDTIAVRVGKSAGPLLFKLDQTKNVEAIRIEFAVEGEMADSPVKNFPEDSYLRFGLVATGERTINKLQMLLAPDWVKKLYELSPKGVGLDKIYFYGVSENVEAVGLERLNPKSDLIYEQIVTSLKQSNGVLEYKLPKSLPTAAIWVSIDGDDSKSNFKTVIKKISLETKP